jgi:hypothetical protein
MKVETRLEKTEFNPLIIGDCTQIFSICKDGQVDRIIVALDERRGKFPIDQLLFCRLKGIRVEDGLTFTEYLAGKLSVENLNPSSLIFSDGFKRSSILRAVKRCFDILFSLVALTFFSPISIMVTIAIKLDSKGPMERYLTF